jgi:hypothetical protein
VRTAVLLFLFALCVRLVLVATFADPAYPDSFYYVDAARSLAAGHGFSVDFVWIFAELGGTLPANPVLPIASFGHWMPLASLGQVPFIWLLGPTAFASRWGPESLRLCRPWPRRSWPSRTTSGSTSRWSRPRSGWRRAG